MATKKDQVEISILEVTQETIEYCVLGKTPFICNRMSEKVKNTLLFPKGRKTTAEKARTMKHNPFQEFRDSPYRLADEKAPTLLAHLATAFKRAIAGTALDIPGATKAQLSRLMWVEGEKTPLYGIPKLHMSVTRSADMNKTPDVRTRAIIPEWACKVTVRYTTPMLKEAVVSNLFAAAGLIQGVGDWRNEKGSGTFGQFELVAEDDPRFQRVLKEGDRAAQTAAMEKPECYDADTEELLSWFVAEADRRGFKEIAEEAV